MIRQQLFWLSRRLYSESRVPIVKKSNKRVSQVLRKRIDVQTTPRIEPGPRTFEPFPYAITEENKHVVIRRVVEPLYEVPYEEQLASKEQFCRNSLRHLAQEIYRSGTPVRLDVRRLPCQVNPIVRSEKITEYRSADEFSIWYGLDGKTPTVGYYAFPISKHGNTVSIDPSECVTSKKEVKTLCQVLQEFVEHHAKSICFELGSDGGWRRFKVKINQDNELMLVGILNPTNFRVREVVEERDKFKDFVVARCKEAGLKLVSLYYQPCPRHSCPHKEVPYELLHGQKTLLDTIGKYKYVVSPETNMHTNNSEFQDAIIRTMIEAFELNRSKAKPLIIDVKCGAGVLAMGLSEVADKVVGVDYRAQAVDDAIENVKLNKIGNCEFVCSEIEIVLERILERYAPHNDEIIVICDVSKRGLHQFTMQSLRDCSQVKKIIFITPKVDAPGVAKNLTTLCSKGKSKSLPPFAPVLATPVDAYPQTELCQMILALERLDR